MKNSTTALVIIIFTVIVNLFANKAELFLGVCIFSATFLIVKQMEEIGKKWK